MTTILLDTHVFLWLQSEPERLASALPLLADETMTLLLSAASSWEIAVKWRLGKLLLPEAPDTYVPDRMQRDAIDALPVFHSHALALAPIFAQLIWGDPLPWTGVRSVTYRGI